MLLSLSLKVLSMQVVGLDNYLLPKMVVPVPILEVI